MQRPAWQKLAESHTDDTIDGAESVVAERTGAKDGAGAESRADASGSSGGGGGGGGGGVKIDVQKPKVALIIGRTA